MGSPQLSLQRIAAGVTRRLTARAWALARKITAWRDPSIVYLGDSHAYAFSAPRTPRPEEKERLIALGGGEYLCWMGPRLMHSVAERGLPAAVLSELTSLAACGSRMAIVWFLGEIDIRVYGTRFYLGKPEAVRRVVRAYVRRVSDTCPSALHIITVPTLPSDQGPSDPSLPRNGSLAERLEVFAMFREELIRQAGALTFDPNQLASGASLTPAESRDGCHYKFTLTLRLRRRLHSEIRRRSAV